MNNKLNCCAYNIKRPNKPNKPEKYNTGATKILDANRLGIAKLRQRRFSWSQIHQCLSKVGVVVKYADLYQWQMKRFGK